MSNNRNDCLARFAQMFGALSNQHRLAIFLRLVATCLEECSCTPDAGLSTCVGDLGSELNIAPSTVSHHLKELHRSGLIRMERRGQKVECWVSPDVLKELCEFFNNPVEELNLILSGQK